MAAKMNARKLQLPTDNQLLKRIWLAGATPSDFARTTTIQDIELMDVALLCDEIMRYIPIVTKKKDKLSLVFMELSYLMSGMLFVYDMQVRFLYDRVVCQSQFTLLYAQRNQSFTAFAEPTAMVASTFKKSRSRKNKQPIKHLPQKRMKTSETEFDWQSLIDMESDLDDESTIQMLQTSKVMNQDQISLREAVSESDYDLDIFADPSQFEACENGGTQKFQEIRELVAKGRIIMSGIRNGALTPVATSHRCEEDEDLHFADNPEFYPLPHIGGCLEESDNVGHNEGDVVMAASNAEELGQQTSTIDVSPPALPNDLPVPMPATTARKRKVRISDDKIQIAISTDNEKSDMKQMRCPDARSDCISKNSLIRNLKIKCFDKPTYALKTFKPTYMKDTILIKHAMKRVQMIKRKKRKESNDRDMVAEFLRSFDRQPLDDEDVDLMDGATVAGPQACTDRLREDTDDTEPSLVDFDEAGYREDEPIYQFRDNVSTYRSDDESLLELEPVRQPERIPKPRSLPKPIANPQPAVEADYGPFDEPNLPDVHHSPIIEPQRKTDRVSKMATTRKGLIQRADIPQNVLQLLDQFVTMSSDPTPQNRSQAMFTIKNQQNKQEWGLRGVLESLFRLWHSGVHPISMNELMRPKTNKLAAALAFYSIMQLNSPKVGLILIEKRENSNVVFNIAMSPKLHNLVK